MTGPVAFSATTESSASIRDDPRPPVLPWRMFAAETITGRIVSDVPFVGVPTWSYGVNIAGMLQTTVPIGAIDKEDLRQLCDYWRISWGLAWGSTILQCGPVVTYQFDDVDGPPVLRVGCVGVWGLFSQKRVIANAAWTGQNIADAAADLNLTAMTLREIARQLVLNDMNRNGFLPIVQPAADPAGTSERSYPGYDLAYVGERLTELTQVLGGPECEFRPEFTDTTQTAIQWRQRIGDTEDPEHPGRIGDLSYPHVYDYGLALSNLDVDGDGSRMADEWWVRGNGMERSLLTGHAADATLEGIRPTLQSVDGDHTSATDQSTLDGWAQGDLATFFTGTETLSATVRIDGSDGQGHVTGSPTLGEVQVGDNAQLAVVGHRWLPDGVVGQRIIQVGQGRSMETAELTLQPTGSEGASA